MPIDNLRLGDAPAPKVYAIVTLENGSMTIKKGMTQAEANKMFEGLKGSGIQTIVTRTSEILKENV